MVVDTSNQTGDSFLPHSIISRARHMMVPDSVSQHRLLLEALANHCPDLVCVDGIGRKEEGKASRSTRSLRSYVWPVQG